MADIVEENKDQGDKQESGQVEESPALNVEEGGRRITDNIFPFKGSSGEPHF